MRLGTRLLIGSSVKIIRLKLFLFEILLILAALEVLWCFNSVGDVLIYDMRNVFKILRHFLD